MYQYLRAIGLGKYNTKKKIRELTDYVKENAVRRDSYQLNEDDADEIAAQKPDIFLLAGGTDGGAIHLTRGGVPTGGISIPTRYVHTPLEMADAGDIEACAALVAAFAQARLD